MKIVQEHSAKIKVELPKKDVSKEMEVFYNPIMASNRNISILLLNSIENKEMRIADILAGSGIRSIRFIKELKKEKIQELFVNDAKDNFPKIFKANLQLNKIKFKNIILGNEEASLSLLKQEGFDYIEIDPFGSPNPFLASTVARISREGIIAVTATDTAALTGTYPKVTRRKYWAEPLRNYLMHEIGLRILIRRIQLQGIQFEKALIPILSYSKDHYYRIYLRNDKGKEKCDEVVKQHQYFLFCNKCLNFKCSRFNKEKCSCGNDFLFAGPLWIGNLSDTGLLEKMVKENNFPEEEDFLKLLLGESKIKLVGFYDLNEFARLKKVNPPRVDPILKKYSGARTHFSTTGIKSLKAVKI